MTTFRTLLALVIAAGCGSTSRPIAHQSTPATPPSGYTALPGPQRCADDCGVTRVHEVGVSGIQRVGVVDRGLTSTLAIETASGWFLEPYVELQPRMSQHHQPHSRGYDLKATRVEEGAVVMRLVDSLSVFYPGQGPAGTSHVNWYERRCVVVDALVHCSPLTSIASRHCTKEQTRAGFTSECTGEPPPT